MPPFFKHQYLSRAIPLLFALQSLVLSQSKMSIEDWFPLHIGNQWSYNYGSLNFTDTIIDTTRIHGKQFYVMNTEDVGVKWFRTSNDSVYAAVLYGMDTVETLLFNFNANIGDSISLPPAFNCTYGRTVTLAEKNDTADTPSGLYTDCFHFIHYQSCADAGYFDSWFAKGKGMVKFRVNSYTGVFTFQLVSATVTTVQKTREARFAPSGYLFDPYPNPFNPQTEIIYRLDEDGFVLLRISDVLGRRVATPVNEFRKAGTYRYVWNASELPSGIYYLNFLQGKNSTTKKMVLQK